MLMRKTFSRLLNSYPNFKYFLLRFGKSKFSSIPKDFQKDLSNDPRKSVLIFTERYWDIHVAWELYISKILQLRNFRVVIVGCDGLNDFCDSFKLEDRNNICLNCSFSLKKACTKFGVEYISMREYLHNNISHLNQNIVDLTDLSFCKELVECSTMRHLRSNRLDDFYWPITEEKFIKSLRRTNDFLSIFLSSNNFDLFVVLNGQFANSRLFIEYSKVLNKPFLTYERGNIKNSLVVSINKNAVPFTMKDLWEVNSKNNLSSSQINKLYQYLNSRDKVGNGHVNFFPSINNNEVGIRNYLNFNICNKTYCLFTNLIWDSAVYGQDTIFTNMYSWIKTTIDFFVQNPTKNLVIRIHPAEVRITWWQTRYSTLDFINLNFDVLPSNIKIIEPANSASSYELMKIADVGLIYTSTAGLEMGILNKPVISSANGHFSGLNLIYEAHSKMNYIDLLNTNLNPMKNQKSNLEIYMYLLYFKKMISVKDINESNGFEFKIDSHKHIDLNFSDFILNTVKEVLK